MSEFDLIRQYCQGIGVQHDSTKKSVGDDAAVICIDKGEDIVVSVDTMVEGVHFFADANSDDLAHKLMAVNLSDMAAMGAEPKWALLALTLPSVQQEWLALFSKKLNQMAQQYGVQLIGGDTTQGPLSMSLTIMGVSPKSKSLMRSGAKQGDDIYVSQTIGDAALALHYAKKNKTLSPLLAAKLHRPIPQCDLGVLLRSYAHSCIDISDGLVADLMHIAQMSNVHMEIDVDAIPVSKEYQHYLADSGDMSLALNGGDDYQLVFTAHPDDANAIQNIAQQLGIFISKIGRVLVNDEVIEQEENQYLISLLKKGQTYKVNSHGYQHFKA